MALRRPSSEQVRRFGIWAACLIGTAFLGSALVGVLSIIAFVPDAPLSMRAVDVPLGDGRDQWVQLTDAHWSCDIVAFPSRLESGFVALTEPPGVALAFPRGLPCASLTPAGMLRAAPEDLDERLSSDPRWADELHIRQVLWTGESPRDFGAQAASVFLGMSSFAFVLVVRRWPKPETRQGDAREPTSPPT